MNFYTLKKADKLQVIKQVVEHQNSPYSAVEKDWRVVQILATIFGTGFVPHQLFKRRLHYAIYHDIRF